MKRILLILLSALLILLPSCAKLPDEPVPPADSGNGVENESFSYPQIDFTEAEIEQVKSALLKNQDIPQEYKIRVGENCEIAIDDVILANESWLSTYLWSFLSDIASTEQEYDPNVVIFDETVFFPEESGAYVYLLLNLKRCDENLKFSEISEASLSNGSLNFTIEVIPNPYFDPNADREDAVPSYEERYLLKISKESLSGKIENLTVDFVYIEVE